MKFFLGVGFGRDPLPLIDSLRELLGCQVGFSHEAPVGVRWVEDPDHPAGGYEQHKPIIDTIDVVGSPLGAPAIANLIRHELMRLGYPDVTVQLDT